MKWKCYSNGDVIIQYLLLPPSSALEAVSPRFTAKAASEKKSSQSEMAKPPLCPSKIVKGQISARRKNMILNPCCYVLFIIAGVSAFKLILSSMCFSAHDKYIFPSCSKCLENQGINRKINSNYGIIQKVCSIEGVEYAPCLSQIIMKQIGGGVSIFFCYV